MEGQDKKQNEPLAELEALLFSYGEPLEIKKIAKVLGRNEDEIKQAIGKLEGSLISENRGVRIVKSEEKVQLATKPEFYPVIEGMVKDEFKEELSPASVEALSIVAYLGPISRPQIDYYRGVNSSFILRSLLMRGLVDKVSDPNRPGIPLYRASFDLIKYLGLSKIDDLPEFDKYRDILKSGSDNPENRLQGSAPAA